MAYVYSKISNIQFKLSSGDWDVITRLQSFTAFEQSLCVKHKNTLCYQALLKHTDTPSSFL